ncbi:MAG TPA: LPS assembly lipoprotein LptE [Gammaproteobacteria bacterium]|nr:LPS assembly lipoprotein LptE [Gammaproteobacteria bacterium]
MPATGLLLAGCGFHLRNSNDLPPVMQRTYLNVPSGNDGLVRELRRNLSTGTISVVDDPTRATATLNILSAQRLQRVLSVSNIGRPLEEEVAYQVQFSLTTPGGTLIAPQTLIQKRNYAYDEANALGDAEQAAVLYNALQHTMAQLIVFRIEAVGRHSKAAQQH